MHLPGTAGCESIGTPCGGDGWPADFEGSAVYVRPDAASGDGSRLHPYGDVDTAISNSSPGDTIVLAAGRYVGPLIIPSDVTIMGACVEETVLVPAGPTEVAVVIVRGLDVVVRNLRIEGPAPGLALVPEATATVEDVLIQRVTSAGFAVFDGATLDADHFAIRGTEGLADGTFGRAVEVQAGATATLSRGVLEGNRETGIVVVGGTLNLTDSSISDMRPLQGRIDFGCGIAIGTSGDGRPGLGHIARVVLERNREAGITSQGVGTQVDVRDVVIRDTAITAAGDGMALGVTLGGNLRVSRFLLDGNGIGVLAAGGASVVALEDGIIRRGVTGETPTFGRGISAQREVDVTVDRIRIETPASVGIMAGGMGAHMIARDIVVESSRSEPISGRFGRALTAQQHAVVDIERARFDDNREVALLVTSAAVVTAIDLVIDRTQPAECAATGCPTSAMGAAVGVYGGGLFDAERFLFSHSALMGLQIVGGEVDLRNGAIRGGVIGINVQDADYDYSRITDGVTLEDNERNIDSNVLPIPDTEVPALRP